MSFSPEQFKNSIRKIRLTDDERLYVRRILERNIETYTQPITSPFARTTHRFILRPMQAIAVMLVVLISSGTGLSYASSETLPGDLLYGFKVGVSEEVTGLVMNDNDRASYEVKRAVKRLEETAQLALVGRLDHDAEKVIREQIIKHTTKASRLAEKASVKNPEATITIAADITNELSAHSKALTEIKEIKKINGELTAILETTEQALLAAAQDEKDGLEVLALENTEESKLRIAKQREAVQAKLALIEGLVATSSQDIQSDIESISQDLEILTTTSLALPSVSSNESIALSTLKEAAPESTTPTSLEKDSLLSDPTMVTDITNAITAIHELSLLSLEFEKRAQYAESFNVLQEALNKAQSILSLIDVQEKYSKILEDNFLSPIPPATNDEPILIIEPSTDSVPAAPEIQIESKTKTEIQPPLNVSPQKVETSTRLRE